MQFYPPEYYDDAKNGYTAIKTRPLASAMGAEILDVDIANITDEQFEQVKDALYRYKMIYFRGQTNMTIEDQEALTLKFGDFGTDAYTNGIEGHPNVQRLIKEASTVVDWIFGDGWHTDSPFLERPPAVSLLQSLDIPPYGGDTWWSNAELAYDLLSDKMKKVISDLRVHMSAAWVLQNVSKAKPELNDLSVGEIELTMDQQNMVKGNFHPLVRTHPVTGKKSLYCDCSYSMGIEGMTQEESKPIIDFLGWHATREEFNCRLRWEPNMLVIWDNRLCLHKAFNDYDGYRREMIRTIVDGEIPA
ncbi:MAG: TauD/TfdA family dioxygenase [Gammaproteobacteria bacterium]|jgi:taurine dioxygenase|nr:TauD/TfdA family dioxygenase [Gammaproteobacteria bacterium]MBT6044232.1 TauD/TfdA family dioxygenase [Gammaproteobacteria bacterium]